jgi:hypothetical protein
LRKRQHLDRKREAHNAIWQIRTNADGMRQHQISLELLQLVRIDARRCELAETGIDAIDRRARLQRTRNCRSGSIDASVVSSIERQRAAP